MVNGVDVAVGVERLSRRFGTTDALKDVSVEIPRGEIFGLVGPDGAGKTTLLQILAGIVAPTSGFARVLECDVGRDAPKLAGRVGYMSQSFTLYGTLTVRENLEFFADIHGVPAARRRERAGRLLGFSRLTPVADRLARDLSGGMQKKLALSTALIHDPEILLLDEPTTAVDPISRREFWQLIYDFRRDGVTVLVTTPYMDEAERCGRVALMHGGEILAVDTPTGLKGMVGGHMAEFHTSDQSRAVELLRKDPDVLDAQVFGRAIHVLLRTREAYRTVEHRLARSGVTVQGARCIEPGLEDVFVARMGGAQSPPAAAASSAVGSMGGGRIEINGLTKRFGGFTAVDALSFAIEAGEVVGFLGPNGSGKSTTMRLVTGILRPSAGVIRVGGFDVAQSPRAVRPILGYMSQRFSLYDDLTVGENLDLFAGIYGLSRSTAAARKAWALDLVQFEHARSLRTGALAGGWKQRLALAAAILHRPKVLLLDEPTSGVDPISRRLFWEVIFTLADSGVTVLVSTHYMDEAERCHRLAFLSSGRLLAFGTSDELRARLGGRTLAVRVADPIGALARIRATPGVRSCTLHGASVHVLVDAHGRAAEGLRARLVEGGYGDVEIQPTMPAMEDVFAALVEESRTTEAA